MLSAYFNSHLFQSWIHPAINSSSLLGPIEQKTEKLTLKIFLVAFFAFCSLAYLVWTLRSRVHCPSPIEIPSNIKVASLSENVKNDWKVTPLPDGTSIKIFSNGTVEIGCFHQDRLQGKGLRYYPHHHALPCLDRDSEISELKGQFEKGHFIKGNVCFLDERQFIMNPNSPFSWDGMFDKGILGKMDYRKVKGSQLAYEKGRFKDMKLQGIGRVSYRNGTKVNGFFCDGVLVDTDSIMPAY